MVYCYFDEDYLNAYNCEYTIKDNEIIIEVDFGNASSQMLEEILGPQEKIIYAEQLTIIDKNNNFFARTFYAFSIQSTSYSGYPFMRIKKIFSAKIFFTTAIESNIVKLTKNALINKLYYNHESFDVFLGNQAKHIDIDKNHNITIKIDVNNKPEVILPIKKHNLNNIKIISVMGYTFDQRDYNIQYRNRFKLEFKKSIQLKSIFNYYDLVSNMCNIFYTNKIPLYKFGFEYDGMYFEVHYKNILYKPKFKLNINKKVNVNFHDLIKSFFRKFTIQEEDRNLIEPFNKANNLYAEDSFLIYYRFLELSLKNSSNKDCWLKNLIKDNKGLLSRIGVKYDSKLHLFISTLRNHYIHEGYYIESNLLELKGANGKKKRVTNEIITKFSMITHVLTLKVMLNNLLNLNIEDENISPLI